MHKKRHPIIKIFVHKLQIYITLFYTFIKNIEVLNS